MSDKAPTMHAYAVDLCASEEDLEITLNERAVDGFEMHKVIDTITEDEDEVEQNTYVLITRRPATTEEIRKRVVALREERDGEED